MSSCSQFSEFGVGSQARLCEDFALTLHAMAQPLTVLRGALGTLMIRGDGVRGADRYIAVSNTQVERLCSLMSGMRTLLDCFQFEAVCAPTNLLELIGSIVENEGSSLHQAGRRLSFRQTGHEIQVLADPVRVEHAMHAAIAAVSVACEHDEEIHVTVDQRDGFADVVVQCTNPNGRKLTSADRVELFVAEASIRSQGGLFELLSDPFRVSLKLPLHDREEGCTPAGLPSLMEESRSGTSPGSKSLEFITQRMDS